jgi:hypothetical protein
MHHIHCKNCQHSFKGKFCPECGQSAHVGRIDLRYFLHDIPHSVFHIDKGFLYTLGHLLRNPGKTMRAYLAGKRVKHFRPFAFVLIMSTACTLIMKGIYYLIRERYTYLNPGKTINPGNDFFEQYPALLIFMMIPLLSLVTWLFHRKRLYNYWEHFLVNTYLAAILNIFFLLIKTYQLINLYATGSAGVNFSWFMVAFMTYYGFAFGWLFHKQTPMGVTIIRLFIMNIFLSFLYMTAFSVTGIMVPWWGK